MHKLRTAVSLVPRLLGFLAGIFIAGAALLMTLDIILRNTRERGVVGVVELGEVGLVVIVMLAMVFTEHRDGHVSSNLLAQYVHPKLLDAALGVALLLATLAMGWIAYNAFGLAMAAWEAGSLRPGLARVPVWPARLAVAVGFAIVTLQLAASSVRLFLGLRDEASTTPQPEIIPPKV